MSTKELKLAITKRLSSVSDNASEEVLKHILDVIEELAKEGEKSDARMQRFMQILDEDKKLLQRLAQ